MAEETLGEKTEQATPRKREEARERGQVARSQDLSSAVILLAAVLALQFFGGAMVNGMSGSTAGILERLAEVDGERENLALHYGGMLTATFMGILPLVIIVTVAALAINLVQVGFLLTADTIVPRLEKLDPFQGMKRLVSIRSFARLLGGLLKVLAVSGVVFWTIWAERSRLIGLSGDAFEEILAYGSDLMLLVSLRVVVALLVLAILEFGFQRWQHERDLRMTRQEAREELKRHEGDPKIRERRRVIHRQLATQQMILQVPRATVVITNPTHVSVALEYRESEMDEPVVLAKGSELLARRIRETAMEHGVPLVERPELARALHRTAEVGASVPSDLFQAVAEVLAYVYRLKGMAAA